MKTLIALIFAALLTGCASPDYAAYVSAQTANANAQAQADAARYNALATIAKTDGTAAVAAAMALALGGQRQQAQIAAPAPNAALQWASVIVPALGNAYAIGQNARVSIAASNNAVANTQAMTQGFVNIAGQIQAPMAPQANVTTTSNFADNSNRSTSTSSVINTTDSNDRILSGVGTLGSGAYTATQVQDPDHPPAALAPQQ